MSNRTPLALDRVLPHDADAERAVIGAMLLDPDDTCLMVAGRMRQEQFYMAANSVLFREICGLIGANKPVDMRVLSTALNDKGLLEEIGGSVYLSECLDRCPTTANVDHYVEIVENKAMLRAGIDIAHRFISSAIDQQELDTVKLLNDTAHAISSASRIDASGPVTAKEAMPAVEVGIERDYQSEGVVRGNSTGFEDMDAVTHGFIDGDMIILAGYRGKGKTSLAANIAAHYCKRGESVFFASLEQKRGELLWRMTFSEAGIVPDQHRNPADKRRVLDATAAVKQWPMVIDDRRGRKAHEIALEAKRQHLRHGFRLVVVDYLQRVRWPTEGKNDNSAVAIGQNTKILADLAGDLNCPVVVLSQFNRDSLKEGERPELHSLRGSGEIEEDAYKALLMSDELDPENDFKILAGTRYASWTKDQLEKITLVNVAKNKNGPTGYVFLGFDKPTFTFKSGHSISRAFTGGNAPPWKGGNE